MTYNKLQFYARVLKLPHYQHSTCNFIERWKFRRKLKKDIVSELPRYHISTGERLKWEFNYIISETKEYDSYTGKLVVNVQSLTDIKIHAHVNRLTFIHPDRYTYEINSGNLYFETYGEFGKTGYDSLLIFNVFDKDIE